MTEKRIPLGPVGERVRVNVEQARSRSRLSYRELSDRLEAAGRPIPTLGLSRLESGDRRVDVDDLAALAAALGVSTSELLGDADGSPAAQVLHLDGMELATREDLARLGDLSPTENTLIEAAYRLAQAIEKTTDARALPALTRELRSTVQELRAGRSKSEKALEIEDDFGDLDDPD